MNYYERRYQPEKLSRPTAKAPKQLKVDDYSVFQLISALDKKLAEIVDGSDQFILHVVAARKALAVLKRYF